MCVSVSVWYVCDRVTCGVSQLPLLKDLLQLVLVTEVVPHDLITKCNLVIHQTPFVPRPSYVLPHS